MRVGRIQVGCDALVKVTNDDMKTVDDRPKGLLRPREVAQRLGVSPATAYAWMQTGTLPSVHLGGHMLRVRPDVLERFIEERSNRPIEPDESGYVVRFLVERCDTGPELWSRPPQLWAAYVEWCDLVKLEHVERPLFFSVLFRRGFRPKRSRRIDGKKARTIEGIALRVGNSDRSLTTHSVRHEHTPSSHGTSAWPKGWCNSLRLRPPVTVRQSNFRERGNILTFFPHKIADTAAKGLL